MRKILSVASVLLLLAVGLAACEERPLNTGETEYSHTGNTENNEGNSDTEETDMSNDKIVLFKDGKTEYKVIRPKTMNIGAIDAIQDFFDDVKQKTNFNLREVLYNDTEESSEKEIIIGNSSGREEARKINDSLSYSGCRVEIVGEKIIVSGYSDNLLDKALTRLMADIKQAEDGSWYIDRDYFYEYDASGVNIAPPRYETASGELEGIYACGEDNYEMSVRGTNESEYKNYLATLTADGFTLYDDNKIGNNLFATYTAKKDGVETVVYTMFYPEVSKCKVVYGVRGYLPATEEIAYPQNAVVTPSITQLGREQVFNGWNAEAKRIDGAPGMGYVIQLADGRYIIIDGGPADSEITMLSKETGQWVEDGRKTTEDAKKLYDFLVANNPNEGKPVIAAWLITHAHGDHTGLANQFLNAYKNDVTVELGGYNFPDLYNIEITEGGNVAMAQGASVFKASLPKTAKQAVLHSGQELYFPGCEIEVIYTQEDYFPQPFATGNHTSMVFRVIMKAADGSETVFTVMGDAEKTNCQQILEIYGAELDCDILQLTHHGFNGACDGIYELMTPEACFWACDPYRYETDGRCLGTKTGYEFNKWIRENVSKHYTSEYTTTIEIK